MPRGVPSLGSHSEVLGSIDPTITDPTPQRESTQWESSTGRVSVVDPPPPWETAESGYALSDARRFVEVPENIEVRWINPRVLDAEGWRDWQPVMASDDRFTVKVATMVSPDGNIRRGGPTGDILAWMYKSWVLSRRQLYAEQTARLTQNAVDQQEQLRDEFKSGKHGPHLTLEGAQHPRYTLADGRTLKRDI